MSQSPSPLITLVRSRVRLSFSLAALLLVVAGLFTLPAFATAAAAPPQGLSSEARIMDDVKSLVDLGPRRTGTPGGDRAAEFVGNGLRSAGVPQVWEEHATTYQWEATSWGVKAGDEPIDAFPVTQSFFGANDASWTGDFSTGPGGRTAQVVDVGNGTLPEIATKDVRGKIVLFNLRFLLPVIALGAGSEWLYDPSLSLLRDARTLTQANPYVSTFVSTVRELQRRGAVGFIGVLADYFDSNKYRNEYYRSLNVTLPGFWITRKESQHLRAALGRSGGKATLQLAGRRWAAQARTVLGYLPGQSSDTVMVQSHHDSLGPGAVEDASGTASVLAQARYWASRPLSERPRSLLFITFDSHFTGYQAHAAFYEKYLAPGSNPPFKIVANATIEHIAKQGVVRNGQLVMRDIPEPRGVFRSGGGDIKRAIMGAVRRYDLQRLALINTDLVVPNKNIPTDASYAAQAGLPTVSYISGPIYLYDDIDTIDKVDAAQVVPVNAAFVDIIGQLMRLTKAQLQGHA